MPSVIETIARHSAETTNCSERATSLALHAITDTIACMVAGADDAAPEAVRAAFIVGADSGPSHLFGGGRASPSTAALVNGTAAHALDFDDNFRPASTHASAVLVPPLLAMAQARGSSGRAFVEAYLVGLAAQAAVGAGLNRSHYTLGWHSTSTIGTIGTAAGVARLLGLDAEATARAMSVAASMAGGSKRQFGTPAKPLHAGLAARNALEAALLGQAGMTGRLDILEGPLGFLALTGGPDAPGWDGFAFAGAHVIETDGVMPKRHPCCGSTHSTVDAILDLKEKHGFKADDVESVDTLVGIANARNLSYPEPEDEMQARFSMHYCVALALLQDRLSLADFTKEAVGRGEVRRLLPLTVMRSYTAEEERAAGGRPPHRITLRLKDGRSLQAERGQPKGSLPDPFTDADRRAKFDDCCAAIDHQRRDELYGRLAALTDEPDFSFMDIVFAKKGPRSAIIAPQRSLAGTARAPLR